MARPRAVNPVGYPQFGDGHRIRTVHRDRAEKALGKPLPPKAVVHHLTESLAMDSPICICDDQRYHMLLHVRTRVKTAGGNPNTDKICSHCRTVQPKTDFPKNRYNGDGLHSMCRTCTNERAARDRAAKRTAA